MTIFLLKGAKGLNNGTKLINKGTPFKIESTLRRSFVVVEKLFRRINSANLSKHCRNYTCKGYKEITIRIIRYMERIALQKYKNFHNIRNLFIEERISNDECNPVTET